MLGSNFQEPWRNPFINTTYHPLKTHFQLTYFSDAETRVCFYIHKRLDPSTWSVSYISRDIIALTIRSSLTGRRICILNVYNEVGTDTVSVLTDSLRSLHQYHETIVLGDFNLHHPLWSTTHRRAGPVQWPQPQDFHESWC